MRSSHGLGRAEDRLDLMKKEERTRSYMYIYILANGA